MSEGVSLFGDWGKAAEIMKGLDERFKAAAKKAMLYEGEFLRSKILEGLREQAPAGKAFTPLSKFTLAVRRFQGFRGTKALLRNADLRNAVVSVPKNGGEEVFVGVLRTAKSKTGKDLVNVADMQENGAGPIVVPITPKSRAFFHAALAAAGIEMPKTGPSGGGAAVAVIRTPARPFLRPVFEKFSQTKDVRARFFHRIGHELAGQLGTP